MYETSVYDVRRGESQNLGRRFEEIYTLITYRPVRIEPTW